MKLSTPSLRSLVSGFVIAGIIAVSATSNAQLTLTSAGVLRGFTLSTLATGFANNGNFGVGPLGIGFHGDGSVLVSALFGDIHKFATDTDGQTANAGNLVSSNPFVTVVGISGSGGNQYVTDQANGLLNNLSSGGIVGSTVANGMPAATGITTNPNNGHLFVSTLGNNVIWDVDPSAINSKSVFINQSADGLSTDGTTLYMESNNHIIGYNIISKALTFDSGFMSCGPDGTQLGSGSLAGFIYANCNNGEFFEIDLNTNIKTAIADMGSRGDFVSADPNGSLLVTQTDRIIRLTAPSGGGFGQTPEPGVTASLVGMGVAGAGLLLRRRSRK